MSNRGSMSIDTVIEWLWPNKTLGDLTMASRGSMDTVIEWMWPSNTM